MDHDHSNHVQDMPMDMSTGMDNGTDPGMGGGGMMDMTLHFRTIENMVLFKSWNFSGGSYAGFCVALIVCCFFKEFLFAWRTHRLGKTKGVLGLLGADHEKVESGKAYGNVQSGRRPALDLATRVFGTVLYVTNLFFGYMIMLVLMTYNWGFIFAILFGSALGHFLFNWILPLSNSAQPEVEAECCEK